MRQIGLPIIGLLFGVSTTLADASTSSASVTFRNADIELAGTLFAPEQGDGLPGVVVVHGSGPGERNELRPLAERLSKGGLAVLIYDKRGSGQSGGNWITSSIHDLAADAAAGYRYLADQDRICADQVGYWGISQGGWIVPLAAHLSSPAFAIVVTGGGVSPRVVETAAYHDKARRGDATDATVAAADALVEAYFEYLAGKRSYEALNGLIAPVENEPWYRSLGIGHVIPSERNRKHWQWVATFDPAESIRTLTMPVLVLLGAKDPLLPTAASARAWWASLPTGVDHNQVVVFPNAGHGMRTRAHDGDFVAGYIATQLNWLRTVGVLNEREKASCQSGKSAHI